MVRQGFILDTSDFLYINKKIIPINEAINKMFNDKLIADIFIYIGCSSFKPKYLKY